MFTQIYEVLANYALGGTAAVILFIILYRKANSVASSGNKAKMASFSIAPAALVILSIAAASAAFNYAIPRLQGAVTSQPVMGAVQAGGIAMQAIDSVLAAPPPSGGFNSVGNFNVQPMNVGSGGFQPVVPNSGWAGGALNYVAPGSMFVMPTVEPTRPPQIQEAAQQLASPVINGAYTVRSGDSMYKIAARLLGNGNEYVRLCNINRSIVGSSCQLTPGMVIQLEGTVNSNYVVVKDDYQPLVLRSAADVPQARSVQPAATAVPLVFMEAMNTPTPTPQPVAIPYVDNNESGPLVLMSAQD